MDLASVPMDGSLRGLMPCDILGKPWIGELDGSCGVGANFRRALQRFRKYTTIAIRYGYFAAGNQFSILPYSGDQSIIANGDGDTATKNGYPAGVLAQATLSRFQTNLSQGGRPCPTTPESTFVITAIEAIAESTKWYSTVAGDNVPQLSGGVFLQTNRTQEYLQHETLRAVGLTYKYDQDGCEADLDPLRFFPSGYGKPGLDAASHNGISVKSNALCLSAWVPIIQSQTDGQPNVSKLIITVDQGVHMNAGAVAPPPVAIANVEIVQEVTIILDGFCVPRDVAMLMCSRSGAQRARDWFRNNAFNPVDGKCANGNGSNGSKMAPP